MTPLSVRARARLTRWARQRQSLAVFVASSTTKPLPSQTSNGQRSSGTGSGRGAVLMGARPSLGHAAAGRRGRVIR
jgi:hypothetical protein